MKKLLTYIIALGLIFSGITTADSSTTFDIDDSIFDITNFSTNEYSTIHFGSGTNGNSFGGAIFWGPIVDKDITVEMNGSNIYCKKQIRGFYINQVRGNILWPLDNSTLQLFKGHFEGYSDLYITGGFFTHCKGDLISDYNGIYGYIKHTTNDGHEYELWAGFDYNGSIGNTWGDSLGQEIDLGTKDFFVKGVIFDSYGGLGFINSTFNDPQILRTLTGDSIFINIDTNPNEINLGGNVKYIVEFGNSLDYYFDNAQVFITIPENISANRSDIGDFSGNKLLLYSGELYPYQSRRFVFNTEAIKTGYFITTGEITAGNITEYDTSTGFIINHELILNQDIRPDNDIIVGNNVKLDITFESKSNIQLKNILILDYLPDNFVYSGNLRWYDKSKNILVLYEGDINSGSRLHYTITGYFEKNGNYSNTVKLIGEGFENINSSIDIKVVTNICGNGIIEDGYEYCDDGENNGNIGYCNDSCSNLKGAGLACKYNDVNYIENGPFQDTLNHRGFEYIEVMRKSCLHRGKRSFAGQWKYDPDEYVTKAEVLKTLVKIRGIAINDFDIGDEDTEYNGVKVFSDVSKDHRFSWYSFYAFNNGLTNGLYTEKNGNKYLNPDGTITRNQMIKAVMTLYKEIIDDGEIDISGNSKLIDVIKGNYYYKYIREAEELGIISGYDMPNGTKTWQGGKSLTRAEFAKIVSIPFESLLFSE